MNPRDKIRQIRESKDLSQPKFAKTLGFEAHLIKNIEAGNQNIPDDLALKLESEYSIPFKWWKTGEGSMFLQENKEPQNKDEFVKTELKNRLDLTDREYELLMRIMSSDKQSGITALKALDGDESAKVKTKKLLNDN